MQNPIHYLLFVLLVSGVWFGGCDGEEESTNDEAEESALEQMILADVDTDVDLDVNTDADMDADVSMPVAFDPIETSESENEALDLPEASSNSSSSSSANSNSSTTVEDSVVEDSETPEVSQPEVSAPELSQAVDTEPEEPADNSVYEDGIYTQTGSYTSPDGRESIGVTLSVENDVVTSVSIQKNATSSTSQNFQSLFADGIFALVVGKNLDEITGFNSVNGSSLTPDGFQNALETIKADAAS